MTKIKVYPFTYWDAEQGVRFYGKGMRSEKSIIEMREKDGSKAHEIVWDKYVEVDKSDITDTGVYYPPEE